MTNPVTGAPLGVSDQRSQIKTLNIAPSWTRLVGTHTVLTLGAYLRKDQYNYYPSRNPFDDFSPDLQSESITQSRSLANRVFVPACSTKGRSQHKGRNHV